MACVSTAVENYITWIRECCLQHASLVLKLFSISIDEPILSIRINVSDSGNIISHLYVKYRV